MYKLDVIEATRECIDWIKKYASENNMHKVVIGMSGGKDSYIAAALCVEAIGAFNVLGVLMPNGNQIDMQDAVDACEDLGINYKIVNIRDAYWGILNQFDGDRNIELTKQACTNVPPRLRMTTLYLIAQSIGARVCGTGNLSEITVGYCTKWGDMASDFNPLANFTSIEVCQIGDELGLRSELVYKTPADGLTGLSDEQNLGIKYIDIHNYIRGIGVDAEVAKKIEVRKNMSMHKVNSIPQFNYFK